ncbi:putative nuclease HARBI1 [Mya arenaria]|uniref:putative nuclease HARBI1 n=1 Tax=Mya arenaria TaxID=6604 RepID=UPI0022E75A58|nr:putative nuclease HARBI1 [Mya arenaria]
MADFHRRLQRLRDRAVGITIPRLFRDRLNPLEVLSPEEVFRRYRFSIVTLVTLMFPLLERATQRSCPLPPLLSVLVTLHFVASSSHYTVIGDVHGLSSSSVCRAVRRVIRIMAKLAKRVVSFRRDVGVCKAEFYALAGFPNVIGLIDGTQVRVRAPHEFEADYVNRKGYHSINVQMVCDAKLRFMNVVAKWPGSVHDSRIFRESCLASELEQGQHNGYILGDSGYGCKPYLLTPYLNPRTGPQERYNEALVRTRVTVERSFGVLKRRSPCLSYGLRLEPEMA